MSPRHKFLVVIVVVVLEPVIRLVATIVAFFLSYENVGREKSTTQKLVNYIETKEYRGELKKRV